MDVATALDPDLIQIQDDIRSDFGWKLDADLESAKRLKQHVLEKSISKPSWTDQGREATLVSLQEQLISGPLTILGAAAEAEDVRAAIEAGHRLIAADGAVGVLNEAASAEIAWDALLCVVSDGDGDMPDLLKAAERNIPFILHAHGDNENEWCKLVDTLFNHETPLILTHQTPNSISGMHNPGGFTDGDRAACFGLAMNVPCRQIVLRGFRTDKIGRWTGVTNPERKMRKLEWMSRVLEIAGVSM